MNRNYKRTKITCILFLVFTMHYSFAQTGKVSGKIIDAKTGEALPGAIAIIEGTTKGASSDMNGNFSIANVDTGTCTVLCRYISYNTKIIKDVVVTAGQTIVVNMNLEPATESLKEVVITATLSRESTNTMLIQQKNSISMSDGISSDVIKRSPDKSTGDVLKRVSGASIQDNKFAIIRGLNDRYNYAMVNGSALPSTEPDRRAFSFDMFPSNLIDNIIITKTASPDLPGEFAGGIIQINTKDIPDENFISFSTGAGYNSVTTFKPFSSYQGGKTDWLGIDDGTRAMPGRMATTEEFVILKSADKIQQSKAFANDWKTTENASNLMNQSYQLAMGRKQQFGKDALGIIFSTTYNNTNRTSEVIRNDYDTGDTAKLFEFNDKRYSSLVLWGSLINLTYQVGGNHKISVQSMYNVNSENMTTMRSGIDFNSEYRKNSALSFTGTRLSINQVNIENYFPESKIKIKSGASYNLTNRDVPNLRQTYYSKSMEVDADTNFTAVFSPSGSPQNFGRFYSKLSENVYNLNADVTIPLEFIPFRTSLKTGVLKQGKERVFDARILSYVINNYGKFYSNNGNEILKHGTDSLLSSDNIGTNGFVLTDPTNPSDRYDASAQLTAAYLLFDQNFGKKLRMVWGARMELYQQKLSSSDYPDIPVNVDTTFNDILPSLNIVYSLTEKSNVRVSASKTLSRPEFRELAPFSFYDFNTQTVITGNDTLGRANITNFDARYEIYPGSGQLLAATVFYKDFKNPIEMVVITTGPLRSMSYRNVEKAISYGIEIEFRKNLQFMSKWIPWKSLEYLTISSNLAFIESKVDLSKVVSANAKERPMQGQSPYLGNIGLQYLNTKNGLGISLLYNQIGRRITSIGTNGYHDIYEAPRQIIDFQVSKRILKKGEFKISVGDILAQDANFYQDQNNNEKYDDGDTRIAGIKNGYTISGTLSYKF